MAIFRLMNQIFIILITIYLLLSALMCGFFWKFSVCNCKNI